MGLGFVKHFLYLQPKICQLWVSVDGVLDWEGNASRMCYGKMFSLSDVLPPFWALRLWVSDEFTATGLHIYKNHMPGIVS